MKMERWYACFYLLPFAISCICMAESHLKKYAGSPVDPDVLRNVSELITSKGYPLEEHTIQTSDGYLLSVQRIPHGINSTVNAPGKKVVLLIHGLMNDAYQWVFSYPNKSLGFVLSDEGYDVWLLNTRGSIYSRKHILYTPNQYNYWNFSFDQVAQYDVPATIDYILDATGKKDLFIIGHSQGTTVMFSMLSEMPDYNNKVKLFIALAPAAFIESMPLFLTSLLPFANEIAFAYNLMTPGEFFPKVGVVKKMYFGDSGLDKTQMNETKLNVFLAHFPSSTSIKSMLHYVQIIKSKKFRKYDYGRRLNLEYYHQEEPPDYDVSRITTPIALFWSTGDELLNPKSVATLRKKLKSLVFDYCVPQPYCHADYFVALSAPKLINEAILNLLSKY